jgi:hypothetical protein
LVPVRPVVDVDPIWLHPSAVSASRWAVRYWESILHPQRYDEVTTSVLDLTGRPPRTFEDFVREHAAEWQPSGTMND